MCVCVCVYLSLALAIGNFWTKLTHSPVTTMQFLDQIDSFIEKSNQCYSFSI